MNVYRKPAVFGNGTALPIDALPLFSWANHRPIVPANLPPLAVRTIARKCRVPVHIAALFTSLAGIGEAH